MWRDHKFYWIQKTFIYNVLLSLLFLAVAFTINQYANAYATAHSSNYVTDIVLDHIPVVDVHLIFSEGALLFIGIFIFILSHEPKHTPFALKSLALFILIRSLFLVMTNLAPPVDQIYINPGDYISILSSGNDLFFSAHTGTPFLLAFIFWKKKLLRYFFLICTVIGGAAVLLGHLHYSIDVFSALFISFGIYHLAQRIFPRDFAMAEAE